jgi:hypothetical protein
LPSAEVQVPVREVFAGFLGLSSPQPRDIVVSAADRDAAGPAELVDWLARVTSDVDFGGLADLARTYRLSDEHIQTACDVVPMVTRKDFVMRRRIAVIFGRLVFAVGGPLHAQQQPRVEVIVSGGYTGSEGVTSDRVPLLG